MNFHTMRFLTVFLIHFVVQATCCPSYEQYSSFIPNHSQSTNHILGRRWVDAVTFPGNARTLWPRDQGSQFHTITYCYLDFPSWYALNEIIENAIKIWTSKLGPPGENSHALRIQEVSGEGLADQPFCFLHQNGVPVLPATWNLLVKPDALVIGRITGGNMRGDATLGYGAPSATVPRMMNKISVNVGPGEVTKQMKEAFAPILAHELGHTFGLFHEHQRSDRDQYLSFDCKYLEGYDQVLKAVEDETVESRKGQGDTIEKVCEDSALAHAYGFKAAFQFTKTNVTPDGKEIKLKNGPFDSKSIMLYYSGSHRKASLGAVPVTRLNAPLVKWTEQPPPAERTETNCELLGFNSDVSDLDKEAIKTMYPWTGS